MAYNMISTEQYNNDKLLKKDGWYFTSMKWLARIVTILYGAWVLFNFLYNVSLGKYEVAGWVFVVGMWFVFFLLAEKRSHKHVQVISDMALQGLDVATDGLTKAMIALKELNQETKKLEIGNRDLRINNRAVTKENADLKHEINGLNVLLAREVMKNKAKPKRVKKTVAKKKKSKTIEVEVPEN